LYIDLGQRIAALRKAQGLTQVQLAEALGVAQQTVAHYEAGHLRLLAGALPTLADQLGVNVEMLVGLQPKRSINKRGPKGKIELQLEQISQPPKARRRIVSEVLESLLAHS